MAERGFCSKCDGSYILIGKGRPPGMSAFDPENFYTLPEHKNPATGERCSGSGDNPSAMDYKKSTTGADSPEALLPIAGAADIFFGKIRSKH